jgi:hypothetical protein
MVSPLLSIDQATVENLSHSKGHLNGPPWSFWFAIKKVKILEARSSEE